MPLDLGGDGLEVDPLGTVWERGLLALAMGSGKELLPLLLRTGGTWMQSRRCRLEKHSMLEDQTGEKGLATKAMYIYSLDSQTSGSSARTKKDRGVFLRCVVEGLKGIRPARAESSG